MAVTVVVACIVIVVATLYLSFSMVQDQQNQVYVLSNGIPMLAERTSQQNDQMIESKSHVEMFHQYFFTLSPDDDYIDYTIKKALYLIDESGVKQLNTLKEKGFYRNIIAASAVFSILTDSIIINLDSMQFTYYGK